MTALWVIGVAYSIAIILAVLLVFTCIAVGHFTDRPLQRRVDRVLDRRR